MLFFFNKKLALFYFFLIYSSLPLNLEVSTTELDKMLDRYYDLHKWTTAGQPTPETLASLGLTEISKWMAKYSTMHPGS